MMLEPKWTRVTQLDNIPLREGRAITVGDVELAIFNLGERVMAVESRCPHKGGPLADGIVSGKTIVCPLHGWRFDLETGVGVRTSAPACVTTYAADVVDGIVVVDLTSGAKLGPSGKGEEAA